MAVSEQYLRVAFAGVEFLLPSSASYAIEQREGLLVNDSGAGSAAAWWETRGKRLPAYHLDADLNLVRNDDWQRAVFLNAQPHAIGLAANDIQLLPRADVHVESFHPLGPAPTRGGQLFSAAWVQGSEVTLVFEPHALATYLLTIKEGA
jgi:hypothetical protein